MYRTNLKTQIAEMNVGDTLLPNRGYKEITIRNYACVLGKTLGRTYSVKTGYRVKITRIA